MNQDNKEALEDVVRNYADAVRALDAMFTAQVEAMERGMLQSGIGSPEQERALVVRAYELEGARKAVAGMRAYLKQLRKQP